MTPESRSGDMGMYRRSDVEGFAEWARATVERLTVELNQARLDAADAQQRAAEAERRLAERDDLYDMLVGLADNLASAAATAAVGRIETLLDEVRAKSFGSEGRQSSWVASSPIGPAQPSSEGNVSFDDPVRDPLPPWDERLLAFPDEQVDLPPIGPIFDQDTNRSA